MKRRFVIALGVVVLGTVLVGLGGRAWAFGSGPEFQVNSFTTGPQREPAIAADGTGNFVVVWSSDGQDGSGDGVFGRRYDGSGAPLGSEFQVHTFITSAQDRPAVAVDGTGNFVVVWSSDGQDGSGDGVFGRRYDGSGAPLGSEFQVNTYTTANQGSPTVAADGAGNFVVVWSSGEQDGSESGVFGQRYDSTGTSLGGEFQVNSYTTSAQYSPAAAADGTGNFVVGWSGAGTDDVAGISARRYTSGGTPVGPEFQVNTFTTFVQDRAAVAVDGAGSFVVAWRSGGSPPNAGIFARRYDASGTPLGSDFQVNGSGQERYPAVAAGGAGNFIVVWQMSGHDGSGSSVHGRKYDSSGAPLGPAFRVNTYTTAAQGFPTVAADGAGNFVVAWTSTNFLLGIGQDGSDAGIFGQRFAPVCLIRGKSFRVRDSFGDESRRRVTLLGRETQTDIGQTIDGDPVTNGATLRIITKGTTDSDQTYVLDPAGWTRLGKVGFSYAGPTGGDGDPVRRVLIRRVANPRAAARLRVILDGSVGTQSLDVVPPNLGDEGGVVLTINGDGGETYCVAFGGAAEGTETRDDDRLWSILNATAEPGCPTP